jgi:hypothetical protein
MERVWEPDEEDRALAGLLRRSDAANPWLGRLH